MGICQASENLEQNTETHIENNKTQNKTQSHKTEQTRRQTNRTKEAEEIAKTQAIIKEKERRLTEQEVTIEETNQMVDRLNDKLLALHDKYERLENQHNTVQLINDNLENELIDAREQVYKEQQLKEQQSYKLAVAQDEINKIETEKAELHNKLMELSVINNQKSEIERNGMYSISDTLYKVQGDTVSKLKYNKQSKKSVVFVNKINNLFYYDVEGGHKAEQKVVKIRDILTSNYSIEKELNKPWFLMIGEKRSILFVTDSDSTRDKWVDFVTKSLKTRSISNASIGSNGSSNMSLSININGLINDGVNYNNNNNNYNKYEEERSHSKSTTFGLAQSPINIVTSPKNSNLKIMREEEFESNPLKFNYPSKIKNCTICNDGHTVQVNIDNDYGNQSCSLCVNGEEYELKRFNFHTPSEHTIDGKQYEMEMHLIHINENDEIAVLAFIFTTGNKYLNKPELSFTSSRSHLVLSTNKNDNNNNPYINKLKTMHESDEEDTDDFDTDIDDIDDEKENDFLDQFFDQLPREKTKKNILLKNEITFDYLFETSSNNFIKSIKTNEINIDMEIFEYMGSLTTPPFTEGVQWLISKKTHFIHYKQLEKLMKCYNNENNARPIQGYFGRTISLRSKSSLSSNR